MATFSASPTQSLRHGQRRPVVLCVLDGWGHTHERRGNAIAQARTPHWDALTAQNPVAFLDCSGLAVGLPPAQMGNSEVGHMTLGLGRPLLQDLPRIHQAIADGTLAQHSLLQALGEQLKATQRSCHILGLLSDGGVHAHIDHTLALIDVMTKAGVPVHVHAFTDGRDTPPTSATTFLHRLTAAHPKVLATVSGRFYAMDRDQRWERVERAYRAIAHADAPAYTDYSQALTALTCEGLTDEFFTPCVLKPYAGIHDGDALIFANFRPDRMIELASALVLPNFDGFARPRPPHISCALGMNEYHASLSPHIQALFPKQPASPTFGEILAKAGLTQLRVAETEKYAHVTYFFNGGSDTPSPGEDRRLIPSPRVAHYNTTPQMSAPEVAQSVCTALVEGRHDVIIVNFANADMVGHTGDFDATVAAIEALDRCLERITTTLDQHNGWMLITADHGNAEQMLDPQTQAPQTAHTLNPVPTLLVGPTQSKDDQSLSLPSLKRLRGTLADVAPTLLDLLGLEKPAMMTGVSLLQDTDA